MRKSTIILLLSIFIPSSSFSQRTFSLVEYNVENIFDTRHDEGKDDTEFLPDATRHWTQKRYWKKLSQISKAILSTVDDGIPDLVALCEVENDQVLHDLTKRSLLRNAGYEYVMTQSPDARGVDVALMYSPFSFSLIRSYGLRVPTIEGMRPTRDILYACGELQSGDILHVFVVHAPSRHGGEKASRPFRMQTAQRLIQAVDSLRALSAESKIVITGDFNDYFNSPALEYLYENGLTNVTAGAKGQHGVKGTYRYKGEWESLDHVLASPKMSQRLDTAFIHAPLFLLEEDNTYGGYLPRRTYKGMKYQKGYSDHLPLVVRFHL
jgi:endonuclease/exonuclease/phosphatase family metal-dependent hydrolase